VATWWKWLLGGLAVGAVVYEGKQELDKLKHYAGHPDDDTNPAPDTTPPESFVYPVPSGHVTSPFGDRVDPVTGAPVEHHNGIDLRAPEGTPLSAPGPGTVLRAWSDDLNGNAIRIKVGDKTFGFAHLQLPFLVKSGDTFNTGDVLAHTGGGGPHEGKSTGPHLHLTMRDASGKIVDPQSVHWTMQA
jgi:murein DD-endopeptidase MepM/ murein hydrolase activator NlpD